MSAEHQVTEVILEPVPSILIESLRSIGYSFETALADIVDNSLSAGATEVFIEARVTPSPSVAVIDNGNGLSRTELLDSMRMGSLTPKATRNAMDLGRFGLGMKTASFSQCRRLTVASRMDGVISAFAWDLDYVVEQNSWTIQEITDTSNLPFIETLPGQGTMVIWEKMDRVFGEENDEVKIDLILNRQMDDAEKHLSLVFHRFLAYEKGCKTVKMWLNGGQLEPIDPFVSYHGATISDPIEPIPGGGTLQSFTLPHKTKYKSAAEYERNGLAGGYLKSQGIYLYRCRRLIIYGTWFGLARKSALTQLCRVKIDIDNSHDEDWKIDVKKASAQLPEGVRVEVRNLINRFRSPSIGVYRRKGAKQVSSEMCPVWNSQVNGKEIKYRISREHPVIQAYLEDIPEEDKASFELVLKLIEAGFPQDAIRVALLDDPDSVSSPTIELSDLASIAQTFFLQQKASGEDEERILDVMSSLEMFSGHWNEIANSLIISEE